MAPEAAYNELAPTFQVLIDGAPAPLDLAANVIGLRVSEELTRPSRFALQVGDVGRVWTRSNRFKTGKEIELKLGFVGKLESMIKAEIHSWEVDLAVEGPARLKVEGYDRLHRFTRGPRTRTFLKQTDAQIVRKIAQEHGLSADVDDPGVVHPFVLQHNVADFDFLVQRAALCGYRLGVQAKKLLFKKPGVSAGPVVTLTWGENIGRIAHEVNSFDQVPKLVVQAWDPLGKKLLSASAKQGDELSKMGGKTVGSKLSKERFGQYERVVLSAATSVKELEAEGRSEFNRRAGDFVQIEVRVDGNTKIRAGTVVEIAKAGKRLDGAYYVTAVEHIFYTDSGYATEFRARRFAMEKGSGAAKNVVPKAPLVDAVSGATKAVNAAKNAVDKARDGFKAAKAAVEKARKAIEDAQKAVNSALEAVKAAKAAVESAIGGLKAVAQGLLAEANAQLAAARKALVEAKGALLKVADAIGASPEFKRELEAAFGAADKAVALAQKGLAAADDLVDAGAKLLEKVAGGKLSLEELRAAVEAFESAVESAEQAFQAAQEGLAKAKEAIGKAEAKDVAGAKAATGELDAKSAEVGAHAGEATKAGGAAVAGSGAARGADAAVADDADAASVSDSDGASRRAAAAGDDTPAAASDEDEGALAGSGGEAAVEDPAQGERPRDGAVDSLAGDEVGGGSNPDGEGSIAAGAISGEARDVGAGADAVARANDGAGLAAKLPDLPGAGAAAGAANAADAAASAAGAVAQGAGAISGGDAANAAGAAGAVVAEAGAGVKLPEANRAGTVPVDVPLGQQATAGAGSAASAAGARVDAAAEGAGIIAAKVAVGAGVVAAGAGIAAAVASASAAQAAAEDANVDWGMAPRDAGSELDAAKQAGSGAGSGAATGNRPDLDLDLPEAGSRTAAVASTSPDLDLDLDLENAPKPPPPEDVLSIPSSGVKLTPEKPEAGSVLPAGAAREVLKTAVRAAAQTARAGDGVKGFSDRVAGSVVRDVQSEVAQLGREVTQAPDTLRSEARGEAMEGTGVREWSADAAQLRRGVEGAPDQALGDVRGQALGDTGLRDAQGDVLGAVRDARNAPDLVRNAARSEVMEQSGLRGLQSDAAGVERAVTGAPQDAASLARGEALEASGLREAQSGLSEARRDVDAVVNAPANEAYELRSEQRQLEARVERIKDGDLDEIERTANQASDELSLDDATDDVLPIPDGKKGPGSVS